MRFNKLFLIVSSIFSVSCFAQPSNDACDNAIRLCPLITTSGTTTDATAEGTDFGFCYVPENTTWFVFTTNAMGGSATVSFTNLVFNPDPTLGQNLQAFFFKTAGDCGVTPFTPLSNCGNNSTDFDLTELIVLDPNTTYYVQVSGTSVGAINPSECTFDLTISGSAVENPDPTVSIAMTTTTICQGVDEEITVDIIDCDDITNYEWTYNGTIIYSGPTNDFSTANLTEDGTLNLTISCGSFCEKTASSNDIILTVIPVSAEAGDDHFIEVGQQTTLVGSGIGSPTWSPSTSLSNTDELITISSPDNTTTYFLTMENMGCFATDTVTVFVGEVLIIYSAFSPNGDNVNDRWHIINSEKFPNMEVNIYDRSGQRVFSAVNYTTEDQWWDGTFKGKDLPTSAYYYVLRLNDEAGTEYKGYVTIIR